MSNVQREAEHGEDEADCKKCFEYPSHRLIPSAAS
jgi:hypothetical protein